MPRQARKRSKSGIYHIMLRGSNRQEIFHDEEDCKRFLEILDKCKKKSELKIYGWCIMGNHVHLLMEEDNEDISITMKRIGVSYAGFYNMKYKTVGHLFQDRYKSEEIETNEYLLGAIRYIHQNPVKAGIVKTADEWEWSSCREYYSKQSVPPLLLNSERILGMFSEEKEKAIKRFKEFNDTEFQEQFLEEQSRARLTDEEAREKIKELLNEHSIPEVKSMPKPTRDTVLKKIKEIEGLSQRQAARILGISPNLIFKA